MYIAQVQPIAILPKHLSGQLSYFIKDPLPIGSIVEIFIQKKKLPALIISIESLSSQKLTIKNNSFALKKINRVVSPGSFYHPALLTAARHISNHSHESIGSILKTVTPSLLLSTPSLIGHHIKSTDAFRDKQFETVLGSINDRMQYYKTIIRESFAKNKTIVLFLPTVTLAEYFYYRLQDLPKQPLLLHGKLSEKVFANNLRIALHETPPPLIIGTSIALSCLRGNESAIIIEDYDSPHYFRHERPFIHSGKLLRIFAQEINAKCIVGKSMASITDLKNDIKLNYLSSRLTIDRAPALIDTSREPFQVFSTLVLNAISDVKGKIILFINRKGFYSYVLCLDCKRSILCTKCASPLTLHSSVKRGYLCHHCQEKFPPDLACAHCQSWDLKGFGVGNEQVLDEIKKIFPYRSVWSLGEDDSKNLRQRDSIKKAFLDSEDGILIGTDLVIEDPKLTASLVIVLHIDNLFSIPDYSIGERILSTLQKLEEQSIDFPLLIQTRFPKNPVFQFFLKHDYKGFMTRELIERKENDFPPFTTFIKLSLVHYNPAELIRRAEFAEQYFKPLSLSVLSYPSFNQKTKHFILITVNNYIWQKNAEPLKEALDQFPYPADIVVDPPSIL